LVYKIYKSFYVFSKEYMSRGLFVRPKDGTSEVEIRAWRGI